MSQSNLELVRSIYAAWGRGDFSSMDWAHPEIELVIADGPERGAWKGPDEVARGWRGWLSAFGDYRVEANEFREVDSDRVLVLMQHCGRGKTSGLKVEHVKRDGANVFRLRDGKVACLALYWDRERALADLGLGPEGGSPSS
jgi:ketosteroid isomerase-like protein